MHILQHWCFEFEVLSTAVIALNLLKLNVYLLKSNPIRCLIFETDKSKQFNRQVSINVHNVHTPYALTSIKLRFFSLFLTRLSSIHFYKLNWMHSNWVIIIENNELVDRIAVIVSLKHSCSTPFSTRDAPQHTVLNTVFHYWVNTVLKER